MEYESNENIVERNYKCILRDLQKENQELKKELSDLKELMLKTINIFEVALELKEVKRNNSHNELIQTKMEEKHKWLENGKCSCGYDPKEHSEMYP